MMEEDSKPLLVNSNDHLYHILKTNSFTFCLICFEDIDSASDGVGQHLASTNHTENIKLLFKACNPSLVDEIENKRFADIVSKSVFDISVLLGKETCYVSKKYGFWSCLMCEKNIIESKDTDANVKEDIIEHILTESHVMNVKRVSFLYRLTANQDFLLLNKSVVYCSVCKDVEQCKELDLLKTVVVHLVTKHPNYAKSHNFQLEPGVFVKNEESQMTKQGFVDARIYLNTLNISSTELSREVKGEHFGGCIKAENLVEISGDISMQNNVPNHKDINTSFNKIRLSVEESICICLLCKKLLTPVVSDQSFIVTLNSHFKLEHLNFYFRTPLEYLINWVTFHNDPYKIKLFSKVKRVSKWDRKVINLSKCPVKKHLNHMSQTETDFVCIICMVRISSFVGGKDVVFKHILNHFYSLRHHRCEEEKMVMKQVFPINKKSETMVKLAVQKEIFRQERHIKKQQRKVRRARRQYEIYQSKMDLSKVKVEPIINQQVKIENHQ